MERQGLWLRARAFLLIVIHSRLFVHYTHDFNTHGTQTRVMRAVLSCALIGWIRHTPSWFVGAPCHGPYHFVSRGEWDNPSFCINVKNHTYKKAPEYNMTLKCKNTPLDVYIEDRLHIILKFRLQGKQLDMKAFHPCHPSPIPPSNYCWTWGIRFWLPLHHSSLILSKDDAFLILSSGA